MSAPSRKSNKGTKQVPFTRETLAKLKRKAVRRGVWFRDLKQSERKLLDLTIRVVQHIRSFMLARLVSRIVDKMCEAMESKIFRLMRTEGRSLAEKLSKIAEAWGNQSAKSWTKDRGFIQYLTISNLSSLKS